MIEASNEDVDVFFNSRGVKFKELNLKDKMSTMSLDEKLKLLSSDGKLIKRPILFATNKIIPGFKEELYQTLL